MERTITITLSEQSYERIQRLLQGSNLSAEELLTHGILIPLDALPADTDALESVLGQYDDAQLLATANQGLPIDDDIRLTELTAEGKRRSLTDSEYQEHQPLLDKWERFVLIRSIALVLLRMRGHDVDAYLNLTPKWLSYQND